MPNVEEELRQRLAARGYAGVAMVPVPAGGIPTAVYRVVVCGGPGPWPRRLQGTVGELRHRIARLPLRVDGREGRRGDKG